MKITIYGGTFCKPCNDSKKLLESKGIDYLFYDIFDEPDKLTEIASILGHNPKTIPAIVVNGKFIGGFEDLIKLLTNS